MNTSIGDISDWLRGCGFGSRTMAVSPWRGREPSSFSVRKAGRLSSSNVAGSWEGPGELLVFRKHQKREEVVLMSGKQTSSNKIDELSNKTEDKQAKAVSFFHVL